MLLFLIQGNKILDNIGVHSMQELNLENSLIFFRNCYFDNPIRRQCPMQLLLPEHQDLLKCLSRTGVTDFRFVKRKGWVFVQTGGSSFAFHRKKVTHLLNGQFVDSYEYYINYPQAPVQVKNWQEVVEEFEKWLTGISV